MDGHGAEEEEEEEEEEEDLRDGSKYLNLALTSTVLLASSRSWVRQIFFPLQLLPLRFCFGASF
jgi:hypothetical protein